MEQVLDNVLSNALAVSPDGATVGVDVQASRGAVVVEVQDEGPGMSADEKARAFDRFWRGRALTGGSGSGLGLAIVKQLVTDDGGSVVLDDAPTGGLCVRISWQPASARSGG
jgi:two-component system, OmpR family, sensor kinase